MARNLCAPRGKGAVGDENADRIGLLQGGFARNKVYSRRGKAMGQGFDVGFNGQNPVTATRKYLGDGKGRALAQVVCVGKLRDANGRYLAMQPMMYNDVMLVRD